jgi:hypothetical protein
MLQGPLLSARAQWEVQRRKLRQAQTGLVRLFGVVALRAHGRIPAKARGQRQVWRKAAMGCARLLAMGWQSSLELSLGSPGDSVGRGFTAQQDSLPESRESPAQTESMMQVYTPTRSEIQHLLQAVKFLHHLLHGLRAAMIRPVKAEGSGEGSAVLAMPHPCDQGWTTEG